MVIDLLNDNKDKVSNGKFEYLNTDLEFQDYDVTFKAVLMSKASFAFGPMNDQYGIGAMLRTEYGRIDMNWGYENGHAEENKQEEEQEDQNNKDEEVPPVQGTEPDQKSDHEDKEKPSKKGEDPPAPGTEPGKGDRDRDSTNENDNKGLNKVGQLVKDIIKQIPKLGPGLLPLVISTSSTTTTDQQSASPTAVSDRTSSSKLPTRSASVTLNPTMSEFTTPVTSPNTSFVPKTRWSSLGHETHSHSSSTALNLSAAFSSPKVTKTSSTLRRTTAESTAPTTLPSSSLSLKTRLPIIVNQTVSYYSNTTSPPVSTLSSQNKTTAAATIWRTTTESTASTGWMTRSLVTRTRSPSVGNSTLSQYNSTTSTNWPFHVSRTVSHSNNTAKLGLSSYKTESHESSTTKSRWPIGDKVNNLISRATERWNKKWQDLSTVGNTDDTLPTLLDDSALYSPRVREQMRGKSFAEAEEIWEQNGSPDDNDIIGLDPG
ncbi:hypothetical protein EJ08DRAFT_357610 [Tothia fuscella]|uniref:Uncharacterized protein n=1 Tax=Tothia fuscella TaxID=1048955 RepID=A0A9P4NLS2_9PEZI|nr:hypothetical protein EJ08DRAFT_357610 [Tothia fuscella]